MNRNAYRLVFSKLRGMLIAVAETATSHTTAHGEAGPSPALRAITLFAMRHVAFAALTILGFVPVLADAQIVPSGAHAPNVISTANGLPQVNVTRPSGAGVSLNTYSQFDVGSGGAILNNSPVNVNTQLAGMISGNPNYGPNDAAKIIVNQVNSNNPSRLAGYLEVAGQKTAAVVVANASGLIVDGGGFINTSRGILTTGNPLIDGSGNLTGFSVANGTITVQGAGLNASNIDEVDLLARAVQVNAALYANTLNVTTGSNNIDYASLTPTAIPGSGAAPGVSIDVSQLGGMYANRIVLTSNENGVGVANAGTIAAQAGDLTLTASGQLVQSGTMTATGNVGIDAASLANTGTIYAQQNTIIGSTGAVTNSGTIAAQQDTAVNSASLNSTGILGAGVNNDGSLGNSGNLGVSTSGQLNATGENVAGGSATLSGSGVNLSGSETAANGNVSLTANAGDLNLSGATTSAGGAINANAAGTLNNNNGSLTAGSSATLTAGNLSNQNGDISSQGPLVVKASGQIANQSGSMVSQGAMQATGGAIANNAGTMQSAAGFSMTGSSLDNTGGNILSLNGDGLILGITGALLNGVGGVIGGNGNVNASAYTFTNAGKLTAAANAVMQAWGFTNTGSVAAGNLLTAAATGVLSNAGGTLSGVTTTLSGASITNAKGNIAGTTVALSTPGSLVNEGGTITQTGSSGPMTVAVSGTFDNSNGGTLQTNSTDLSLTPASLDNDGGSIVHAGTGTLTLDAGNGTGAISNANGTIESNGKVVAQVGSFNNAGGLVLGQTGLAATVSGALNNSNGKLLSNTDLSLASGMLNNNGGEVGAASNETIQSGSMTNSGGSIVAPNLALSIGSTLDNSNGDIEANQLALGAADLLNHGGTITQYGTGPMAFSVSGTFDNSNGGTLQTNSTDLTLNPATLDNDGGKIIDAGTGTLTIKPGNGTGSLSNVDGQIITAGQLIAQAGGLNNTGGVFAAQGNIATNVTGVLVNTQGAIRSLGSLSLASGGALTNTNGQIQSGTGAAGDASTLSVQAASIDNTDGLVSGLGMGNTTVQGGSQTINAGGVITGNGNVEVDTSALSNTLGGQVSGGSVGIQADTVDNSNGEIGTFAGSTGDVAITTTGAITNSNGQIGATHNLDVSAATLNGGGAYSAANDVAINVQGDFAPSAGSAFNAGHDLSFTLPGTFTNNAALQAVANLDVDANDIQNSGAMMAGGTLTTHSATLENTGAMVGGSVSLNATQSIQNVGPTALIGATDSNGTLEILAPDIENRDDTTATDTQATTAIYGLGKVVLAGGKDANGNYTNANLIRNQSALIQSAGDMTLDANQVTNTRTTMTTTGLNQPVDPSLLTQLGISLSGCTAVDMTACSAGHPYVGWTTPDNPAFLTMIGGVYTVPPHGGQWNSGYQYTTYTGVALANLIASISPQAQIIAGGKLDASKVGLFQNYWSAVAAAGNIAMPGTLDQGSWQGQTAPEVQVTYSGYYHYTNYDHSIGDWTLPFGNAPFVGSNPGGYQVAPADVRYYSLPSYESTFVAGGTISGTGVNIDNTAGNAGIPSLGLVPGQSLGGVTVGGVAGNAGGSKGGSASLNGGSGTVNSVIASATAVNVLSNLTIPQGGLFHRDTAPNAPYLIETNPAFTSAASFISSDYYLNQLGLNPQNVEKRLGDGLYEEQLVQNQITSLTGKAVLGPYTDTQAMYEALMSAGASLAESLNLPLGMALSADQVAALTSNVVIMQTEIVDGQSVLVPVVYLAKASQQDMNGPLIAATDIDLQNAQTFQNSGTVQSSNTLSIQGQQINNAFGTLSSGGLMSLTAAGNVDLTSATVNAGSLALNAGGNLILNTAANTVNQVSATGASRTTTTLGPIANLNVKGNAAIVTGGNFEQNAGNLNVGGNLGMAVGGNYDIGSVQTGEHKVVAGANGISNTDINQTTGSNVNVGGVSAIGVGGNLTATGANINLGGGGTVVAKGDVTLQDAKATSTVDSNSSGSDHHGSYAESLHTSDDTLTATNLHSGDSLTIASGNDLNVVGSTVELDKGNATLAAVGNVNIGAATETHVDNSQESHSHSEIVSSKQVASSQDTTATYSQGSTISADGVSISSGKDINVAGSNIVGTNNVSLAATGNVNITTSQDTLSSQSTYEERDSGFLSGLNPLNTLDGGLQGYSVGVRKTTDAQQATQVTNNASMVGALNGNLSISAGNDVHVTGSALYAGNNVGLAGKSVTIDAAYDTATQNEQQSFSQTGITAGIASPVISAVQTGVQMAKDVQKTNGDARLDALAAATTGLAGKNAYDTVASNPSQLGGIGVNVSIGTSHSNSNSTENSTTAVGSTVTAGNNLIIAASGAGADSNINVIGSNLSAGNSAALLADGNINLQAAQNTDSQNSTNSGSSGSIGVTFGVGQQNGFSIQAGVSATKGNGNGSDTTYTNTHVSAGNTLTLQSGGDTNLVGAVAGGGQVVADVGGNLNIQSLQDTSHYDSKQTSGGVSVSVCVPPICYGSSSASASFNQQKLNSNYASVSEQSGIEAGDGGFQINVKGSTGLTGGVISSSDAAVQSGANSLTTGTLTYKDIQNQASYSGSSLGISGGYGGDIGKSQGGSATSVNPIPGTTLPSSGGLSVAPPVALSASGDANSTTRSAISGGAITITNDAAQLQLTGQTAAEAAAGISRDTSSTENALAPIFDQNKIEAGFDITSQLVNQVGTFVNNRAQEADAAQAAANDPSLTPEQRAVAQQQADQLNAEWGPSGSYRQVLTALTVAAGGNVTGGMGQFAQAATVAYIQELGANAVKQIADSLDSDTARAALHAIVGCAGAAASGQACGAGAMGAAASSVIGSLLGPTANMSAADREARENLVNSLVAGIAAAGGVNAATATGAAQIEVENNQASIPAWLKQTYGSPVQDIKRWVNQFMGNMNADAQTKASQSPSDLAAQGVANGINALPGASGGEPPTTGTQGVLVNGAGQAAPTNSGSLPDNATLNNGSGDDNGSFWSSTSDKTSVQNAYDHSVKHGDEFPDYQNSLQYVQAAQDFVNDPPPGTLTKTRPNGDTLYYDPASNTFAVQNANGAPKTMFKPSAGMAYWNKQ